MNDWPTGGRQVRMVHDPIGEGRKVEGKRKTRTTHCTKERGRKEERRGRRECRSEQVVGR